MQVGLRIVALGLLVTVWSHTNSQEVTLESKQVGHRLEIYATNSSDLHQELILELDLNFVTADRSMPIVDTLAPGERLKAVVLEPDHLQKWKYSTRYSNRPVDAVRTVTEQGHQGKVGEKQTSSGPTAKRTENAGFAAPLNSDDEPIPREYLQSEQSQSGEASSDVILVVYGQKGCPRCTHTKSLLDQKGMSYRYVDIGMDKKAQSTMQKAMFDSGFEGGSFTLPVLVSGEEVHYSIKDIDALIEGLRGGS